MEATKPILQIPSELVRGQNTPGAHPEAFFLAGLDRLSFCLVVNENISIEKTSQWKAIRLDR